MNSFFLIGAIQSLFFVLLVLTKKEKYAADNILMLWILSMGLHLFAVYLLMEQSFNSPIGVMILLIPPLIYTGGPLLYIYSLMLTKKVGSFKLIYLLHFIPFFASIINYAYMYFFMAGRDPSYFLTAHSIHPTVGMIFYLLNIFLNPVYVVIVLILLRKHQQRIKNEFSYTEKIDLKWLKFLAAGLGSVSVVVWIVHLLIGFGVLERNYQPDAYIFATVVVFIFILGYYGFKQGIIYRYSDDQQPLKESARYKNSYLEKDQVKIMTIKLANYMEEELPFLENRLSLNQMAKALETTSHMLSQLLNEHLDLSFFDYINKYRVEEVKRRIQSKEFEHLSLLGIALDAGFNSKSSFNRIFKEHTGQTPTEFKKAF